MSNFLQSLNGLLPEQVTLSAVLPNLSAGGPGVGKPSYFDLNITDPSGILHGSLDAFCIDTDRPLGFNAFDLDNDGVYNETNINVPTLGGAYDEGDPQPFQATVYSSYDPTVLDGLGGLIENPGNLDLINWILNNTEGTLASYTTGEIQMAIWELMDDTPPSSDDVTGINAFFGGYERANVDAIKSAAQTYGEGFVPQAGEKVAIILVPDGNNGAVDGVPDGQVIITAVELAKLGNFVFEDLDADGIQDANEVGIEGAKVNLLADVDGDGVIEVGEVVDSTTTDANGEYHFTVLPGDYKVQFETPNGYDMASLANQGGNDAVDSDGPISDVVSLDPGEVDPTIDAGFFKKAKLGDKVFYDVDRDGVQDAGELGVEGVTVTLTGGGADGVIGTADDTTATTATDANGMYLFDNLTPSEEYKVTFSNLPQGFEFTTADAGADDAVDSDADPISGMTQVVTLQSGEYNDTLDAGIVEKLGAIGDRVWYDNDGDGVQDAGETGINGVTVKLINKDTGALIATDITEGDGGYLFEDLAQGNYTIMVDTSTLPVSNLAQTGDPDATLDHMSMEDLAAGEVNLEQDFGYQRLGAIGDRVWYDNDGDGVQDAGETGINNVTVKLINKDTGALIATDITEGDGGYLFEDLAQGNYTVMVDASTLPVSNLVQTGDPDATLDHMSMEDLAAGEVDLEQDFGYQRLGAIGDRVWYDNDGDGVQDAGETGINGVTVKLINKDTGALIATDITEGDGGYLFEDLAQGNYTVMVDASTLPTGNLVQTGDPDAKLDHMSMENLAAGEINLEQDFGYQLANPGIDIEKYVNGIDVTDLNNLPSIVAGEDVTFTYEVTNTGNVAFAAHEVVVTDDHGTPHNTGDDFTPTLITSSDVGSDGILSAGETWVYTSETYAAQNLTTSSDPQDLRFNFTGSSYLDGADGNVRTFTQGDVSVDVSAFRRKSGGTWDTAYLGAYSGGLGVTNRGESTSYHRVDNGGSVEYLLFEFDQDVTLNKAFLNYVGQDSDISVWIGDRNGADLSALSDNLLSSFVKENNFTSHGYSRWADVNHSGVAGDTVVISAYTGHTNDSFKLKNLDVSTAGQAVAGVYQNTATVTAGAVSDSDISGYVNATPTPGIDIEKFVNGIDVTDLNNLPEIAVGADVTFTYEVTNTGNVAFAAHEVVVTDDHGTPHNTSDDFTPTLVASSDVGNDGVLSAGETWLYTSDTYAAQNLTTASSPQDLRFNFTGSSPLDGPDGNVRTFTQDGVSVDVSAFRRKSGGTWQTAYLGAYSGGLGVTNAGESTSYHRVDNGGSVEYLLFEFDQDVTLNKAFLNYVGNDSDISVWIGDRNGADLSALSDNLLSSFVKENNFTSHGYSRWADVNHSGVAGDTVVISAYTGHTNDSFKLKNLDVSTAGQAVAGVYQNTATVTAGAVSDSDTSGYVNSQSQSTICAELVGSTNIHEGNQGSYYVKLDAVSTVDRYFTLQVDNGSAKRVDHYAGDQDIIWGGYYDVRDSWGNVTRVAYDRVPNGTDPRLGDRPATGPGDASWDYTLYKNGAIDTGNTITVKVAAGQTQSETFQVQTWLENVTVDRDSPNNSGYYEGTEQFSIRLVSGDANQFCNDHLTVSIQDQTQYDFVSPIVLDLNGDGVQTTALGATTGSFDLLANGSPIESGWLSGKDAFLAVDQNQNGVIDSNDELFGGGVGDGFAKLSSYDVNGDSLIDGDEILAGGLILWQDGNENHRTDVGELLSLASQGIESLSTTFEEIPVYQHGNLLLEHGVANRVDGSRIDMVDAYFEVASAGTNLHHNPEPVLF